MLSNRASGIDTQMDTQTQQPLWRRIWTSNRGMVLILLGEIFRSGMTAATRLLEVDVDGREGMGTLQVSIIMIFIRNLKIKTYSYSDFIR